MALGMTTTTRKQRHADVKAAIVQAARAAILEDGPEHFSLRDVARRSGYSPAGLYEYFSGKDDLVRAVADESVAQLHAALSRVAPNASLAERLVELGLAYVRFAHENPQHFMLIFARLPSRRALLEAPPSPHSPFQIIRQTVRDGIDTGVFIERPGFGLEQMAYGIWATAHGMAMLQQTHLRQFAAESPVYDRAVLELYVQGLQRR
jgi:AcrR family transcriptional regulator